jgi:hypothetical protein
MATEAAPIASLAIRIARSTVDKLRRGTMSDGFCSPLAISNRDAAVLFHAVEYWRQADPSSEVLAFHSQFAVFMVPRLVGAAGEDSEHFRPVITITEATRLALKLRSFLKELPEGSQRATLLQLHEALDAGGFRVV